MSGYIDLTTEAARDKFKQTAIECLGGEWPVPPELEAFTIEEFEHSGCRIEKVRYQVEVDEFVNAYVLRLKDVSKYEVQPAVAVWHQHNGEFQIGKSEPAGLIGNPIHHSAVALAKMGFTVLCPDAVCFEERGDSIRRGFDYEHFLFLDYVLRGKSLAWKNILDMKRAIDYLCSRDDVDSESIGCYGHSLGSTFTWLIGPFEPRLKCMVGNCCMPTYEGIRANHLLHSFSNFIPGLAKHGDTPDLAALIAPRPLHLSFGAKDLTNPIDSIKAGLDRIQAVYSSLNADDAFSFYIDEEVGHTLSENMWKHACGALTKYLLK